MDQNSIWKNIKTEEMTGSQTCPLKKRLVIYLRKKAESKFTLKKLSKNAPLSPIILLNGCLFSWNVERCLCIERNFFAWFYAIITQTNIYFFLAHLIIWVFFYFLSNFAVSSQETIEKSSDCEWNFRVSKYHWSCRKKKCHSLINWCRF